MLISYTLSLLLYLVYLLCCCRLCFVLSRSRDVEEKLSVLDAMIQDHQEGAKQSRRCRCAQVVEVVLTPMARHWMGVGDVPKAVYYLLETCAATIYLSNNLKVCVW